MKYIALFIQVLFLYSCGDSQTPSPEPDKVEVVEEGCPQGWDEAYNKSDGSFICVKRQVQEEEPQVQPKEEGMDENGCPLVNAGDWMCDQDVVVQFKVNRNCFLLMYVRNTYISFPPGQWEMHDWGITRSDGGSCRPVEGTPTGE